MQGLWWLRVVANVGRFAAIDANILAPYPFRRPCNKVLDAVSSFVLTCMSHTHIVTANVASIDDQYLFRAYVDNKAEDTSHTDMPEVELHFAFLQDMIQATRTITIDINVSIYAITHTHCMWVHQKVYSFVSWMMHWTFWMHSCKSILHLHTVCPSLFLVGCSLYAYR